MASRRYFAAIKRLIRTQAPTQELPELHWYDYGYLFQMIRAYLLAKGTQSPLTAAENRYVQVTATDEGPQFFYLAPTFAAADQLVALGQRQEQEYTTDIAEFNAHLERLSAIQDDVDALGEALKSTDLASFSLQPQPDWLELPIEFLEQLLTPYLRQPTFAPDQLEPIFGEPLVSAFWAPSERQLPTEPMAGFFDYLDSSGVALLSLLALLSPAGDATITTLTILWLKWFKHEKTFSSMEVTTQAQGRIRMAAETARLLERRQYAAAKPLLIEHLPALWD